MGLTYKTLFFVFLWLGTFRAQATSVSFDFAHGADYESSTVSLDGEFGNAKKDETIFDWTGSFSKSKFNTQDNLGNPVIDNTYYFLGGLGFETPGRFSMSGDWSYSVTPEEAIVSYGPSVTIGYNHFFTGDRDEKMHDAEETRFVPRLNTKLIFSSLTHDERFGTETRRSGTIVRPTTGINTIVQRSAGLSMSWKPVSLMRLKGSYTSYTYSRNVNEFLQYLDAQPRRVTGLSGAISGFARHDYGIEVDFYLGDIWEVALIGKRSKIISDESTSRTDKLMVYVDILENFRLGVGGQRSASDAGSNTVANEGLLSLSYDF